jgi:hypothetical protein
MPSSRNWLSVDRAERRDSGPDRLSGMDVSESGRVRHPITATGRRPSKTVVPSHRRPVPSPARDAGRLLSGDASWVCGRGSARLSLVGFGVGRSGGGPFLALAGVMVVTGGTLSSELLVVGGARRGWLCGAVWSAVRVSVRLDAEGEVRNVFRAIGKVSASTPSEGREPTRCGQAAAGRKERASVPMEGLCRTRRCGAARSLYRILRMRRRRATTRRRPTVIMAAPAATTQTVSLCFF